MHRDKYRLIIPYLLPTSLLYAVFVLYPYVSAMYTSLTIWHGYSVNKKFVGLYNFEKMFEDDNFWNALQHNLTLLVLLPLLTLSISLFFAFLFTQVREGGRFYKLTQVYRITYFFPQVMSAVAIAVLADIALRLRQKVEEVRLFNVRGKIKRMGRYQGKRRDWRKAYVRLKAGEKAPDFIEGV